MIDRVTQGRVIAIVTVSLLAVAAIMLLLYDFRRK